MLHVTNGQCAAAVLRAAGFDGDVLCWDDVLHEGPVPALPVDHLRSVRASFLGEADWTTFESVLRDLTARDARLSRAAIDREAITLWFEHDLYDQLQLVQVLAQLAKDAVSWDSVALVCGAEYLGPSSPERLRERYPQRAPVTAAAIDLARRAWDAFRAPEPDGLIALSGSLEHTGELADISPLPFLAPALRRHLQQYPSTFNGLSRSEHQALEAIAAGAGRVRTAFVASHHRREDPIFLGDTVFADYLRELSRGPAPLVRLSSTTDVDVLDAHVALTEAGEAVLQGAADRVRINGIDRWLGGVHLQGHDVRWRWDGRTLQPQP